MRNLHTIADVRAACEEWRSAGAVVGLVPTMGAFHGGHRSLMDAARAECDRVVVSLFVNPTQFAPNEDLAAYPRDLEGDRSLAEAVGVDVLFAPDVEEIYPEPGLTTVHVEGLTARLCGADRPAHFDGVTTVVAKLFSITGRCRAYFGRKDAQQLAVVQRMARDLDLPVEVVGCPLVREPDGLAMSSRNAYLGAGERASALALFRSLRAGADAVEAGLRDPALVGRVVGAELASEPSIRTEYVEVVDPATLEPRTGIDGSTLVAIAARVGPARLIDNMTLEVRGEDVSTDLGVTEDAGSYLPVAGIAP
ncbi:MAG TPA: pantoate--beta-alanine ligase [Acidimicrobiia bacterium]|nr:pantoate--beta-alanine ligase [Acidimicrobiia bacterium]